MVDFLLKHTDRGFAYVDFVDRYDHHCSLQRSSLATEDCIWLGIDDVAGQPARMHLTRELVGKLLPILVAFVYTGELCLPNKEVPSAENNRDT